MSSSGSGVSDSQSSQISNFSLGWSQDTTNQVLKAVGINAGDGDRMIQLYHSHMEDEDEEDIGASEVSVSRAVVNVVAQPQPPFHPPLNSSYPPPSSSQPPTYPPNSCTSPLATGTGYLTPSTPHATTSLTPSPAPRTPQQFTWDCNASSLPPPPSLHPPPPPSLRPSCVFADNTLKSNVPINLPYPGDYDFGLVFEENRKKSLSKNTTCTYFGKMQRLYIKQTAVVPFSFTINRSPPPNCVLRAMAIHKTPEMISENLVCCHKHMDEQRRACMLYPQSFIRSHKPESFYQDDPITGRLSVVLPCSSLLKKSEDVYTTLYTFPCYTSDVQKSGQQVQIVFTLESDSVVLGRCTVDIRVCASPGRDRGTDERKLMGEGVSSDNCDGSTAGVITRRGRKRGASRDVVQCTLPPKQVCQGLTGTKLQHTITTYPALFPYIDVCVRMMEQVYSVKVEAGGTGDGPAAASNSHEEMFTNLDRWLEHLDLTRYKSMLDDHGVCDIFQVPTVTDEELKRWGMSKTEHRKAFLDGKSRIQLIKHEDNTLEDSSQDVLNQSSPALFPSTPSSQPAPFPSSQGSQQLSQLSTSSTPPFSQAFEVMHIQVTKTFSNSQL